jgi:hypothetical protein
MNPEFQRNVWLELTPRRLGLMIVLLGLAFFAAAVSSGSDSQLGSVPETARWLYYAIVVVWGTRNAALAMVGEIRDRTWDMQRLSAIEPGAMTWGKLFGATVYNWFGGAICLAVLLGETAIHQGPAATLIDLVYYLAVGVIAQAAALLASLVAVRRRPSHSRFDVFVYQVVGLAAGMAVYTVWSAADPAGLLHKMATDFVVWWGRTYDTRLFLLVSLAIFTAWTLVGCYREMRVELKMKNGTLVWLAFLIFVGVYVAGFDAWLATDKAMLGWDAGSRRLALAATSFALLTYMMVVLEPKDRVHYRWLGSQLAAGRIGAAWNGLQAWMMAYAATLLCGAVLLALLHQHGPDDPNAPALVAAGLGFLTRDVWIFVLMRALPGRRRSDLAALAVLLALYVFAPAILNGLGLKSLLFVFYPQETQPPLLGPAVAWAEGLTTVMLAAGRIALAKPAVA